MTFYDGNCQIFDITICEDLVTFIGNFDVKQYVLKMKYVFYSQPSTTYTRIPHFANLKWVKRQMFDKFRSDILAIA